MTDPTLTARNLTKRYGAKTAVDGLSFDVPRGAVTAMLGLNGAGKTTVLRIALGLARPTSGEVRFGGDRYRDLPNPASVVGALLDGHGLHPDRSARDHLRVAAAAQVRPDRLEAVLESVGLGPNGGDRVRTFSLGMKQRLGLAAAMLGDPKTLILDEPMNGLDPEGVRWLRERLRGFAREGGAVLVSSHVLSEVERLADEVLVIDRGRKLAAGPLNEVVGDRRSLEETLFDLTGSAEESA